MTHLIAVKYLIHILVYFRSNISLDIIQNMVNYPLIIAELCCFLSKFILRLIWFSLKTAKVYFLADYLFWEDSKWNLWTIFYRLFLALSFVLQPILIWLLWAAIGFRLLASIRSFAFLLKYLNYEWFTKVSRMRKVNNIFNFLFNVL